jgi:glyoxylate/hydroxypyruvate reductase A
VEGIITWAGSDGLNAMLPQCHYVVCVLPLTDLTHGLMDRAFFDRLPMGAHLVNIGRGEHVVDADLLAALDSGRLAGAFLDVFDPEPLPKDHPFWLHPNIIVTPHVAGELLPRSAMKVMADNMRRHLKGEPLPNLYDRTRQY